MKRLWLILFISLLNVVGTLANEKVDVAPTKSSNIFGYRSICKPKRYAPPHDLKMNICYSTAEYKFMKDISGYITWSLMEVLKVGPNGIFDFFAPQFYFSHYFYDASSNEAYPTDEFLEYGSYYILIDFLPTRGGNYSFKCLPYTFFTYDFYYPFFKSIDSVAFYEDNFLSTIINGDNEAYFWRFKVEDNRVTEAYFDQYDCNYWDLKNREELTADEYWMRQPNDARYNL